MPDTFRKPGNGDFGSATYWSVALADGQDAYVSDTVESFTAGLSLPGIDLKSLTFGPTYGSPSSTVGTAGGPLELDVNDAGTGRFRFLGRGAAVYLRAGTGGTVHDITFAPQAPGCQFFPQNLANSVMTVERGVVVVPDSVDLTTFYQFGGQTTIRAHASDVISALEIYGGTLILERDFTALKIGGNAQVFINLADGVTGGTIELVGDPANCRLSVQRGNLGNLTLRSGLFDKRQLLRSGSAGTTTVAAGVTEFLPPAHLTFTDTRTLIGTGPIVRQG